MTENVEIFVEIFADTTDAILIDPDSLTWILRSQIADESDLCAQGCCTGDEGNIIIPEWLAMEKGLI